MRYDLCNQTVTVYHQESVGNYTRTVHERAFFDFKKTQNVDKTGSRESNGFLLVIPGDTQSVFVGGKVILGVGPEITTNTEWAAFIPSKVPNMAVVSYADPKYFGGVLVHTEAGG
jgi:hypothetical protein